MSCVRYAFYSAEATGLGAKATDCAGTWIDTEAGTGGIGLYYARYGPERDRAVRSIDVTVRDHACRTYQGREGSGKRGFSRAAFPAGECHRHG